MAEVNQYTITNKELTEIIIKSAGVHEGRWYLMINFGLGAANIGPTPETTVPGAIIGVQSIGIQRDTPATPGPPALVIDAAKVNPATVMGRPKTKPR